MIDQWWWPGWATQLDRDSNIPEEPAILEIVQ